MKKNKNYLEYKGFRGNIDHDLEDGILYGKILGIKGAVLYQGETLADLEADFKGAVDDYIEHFEERGLKVPKPNLGSFNVRVGAELHYSVVSLAQKRGITLNGLVKEVLSKEVNLSLVSH